MVSGRNEIDDADIYQLLPEGVSDDCAHEQVVNLGGDHAGNQFFRCVECEVVVIQTGSPDTRFGRDTEESNQAQDSESPGISQDESRGTTPTEILIDRFHTLLGYIGK